jgi:hypothetical protein
MKPAEAVAYADKAIAALELGKCAADFESWWREHVTEINRLSAYHPREYDRIAKAVEAAKPWRFA